MRKFISIIAIIGFSVTTSAQRIATPPIKYLGKPQIVPNSASADAKTVTIVYNGDSMVIDAVNPNTGTGTGILLRPRTRPGGWYRTPSGIVDDGLSEATSSAGNMSSLVYYVKMVWVSKTEYIPTMESKTFVWTSGPNDNNASWYTPGTFDLVEKAIPTVQIEANATGFYITSH